MNIASIYPNGADKKINNVGNPDFKRAINKELKAKAMEMLSRGIKIFMICRKLGIEKGTVKNWQAAKERY